MVSSSVALLSPMSPRIHTSASVGTSSVEFSSSYTASSSVKASSFPGQGLSSSSSSSFPSSASSSSPSPSSSPSSSTVHANIKVSSAVNQNTLGFLQLTGAQDRFVVGGVNSADTFSFTNPSTVITNGVDIVSQNAPASHLHLAGLISPGVELLPSNSK